MLSPDEDEEDIDIMNYFICNYVIFDINLV